MQKWEYLFIRWISSEAQWEVNGLPTDLPEKPPSKHKIANRYGQEGWELIALETNWHDLVFKRPV